MICIAHEIEPSRSKSDRQDLPIYDLGSSILKNPWQVDRTYEIDRMPMSGVLSHSNMV